MAVSLFLALSRKASEQTSSKVVISLNAISDIRKVILSE
jgi:hypothetical protein